jgi:Zn-dependent protease
LLPLPRDDRRLCRTSGSVPAVLHSRLTRFFLPCGFRDPFFDYFLELAAGQHHAAAATQAAHPDIGPDPVDLPAIVAARVTLACLHNISNLNVNSHYWTDPPISGGIITLPHGANALQSVEFSDWCFDCEGLVPKESKLLFGGPIIIAELLTRALVLLISMAVHEFAHSYVGYRMGDPTPREMGRLTLNPFVHINWFGWAMFVVIGFGILGSAPINENRMRDRRWGFLAAVAAGPISNLLLAMLCAIPFWLGMQPESFINQRQIIPTIQQFLFYMIFWNTLLFIFNLLPFFPFDGWHIVRKLLPPELAYTWEKYQQISMYIFFGLILLSFARIDAIGYIIRPPWFFLLNLLIPG